MNNTLVLAMLLLGAEPDAICKAVSSPPSNEIQAAKDHDNFQMLRNYQRCMDSLAVDVDSRIEP